DWFDHHGFEQAELSPEPSLRLEIRVNREQARFEFLEPVMLELKLTNITDQPMLLPDDVLNSSEAMTVIIKRRDQPAKARQPYAHYCRKPGQIVLKSGDSLYESLFVAAGRGGWQIAEPGDYLVQVCLHRGSEDIVSNALRVRVQPPLQKQEELLAQDFFEDDVARLLTFDGGDYSRQAKDTLQDVAAQLSERRVAEHVKVALYLPETSPTKYLDFSQERPRILVRQASYGAISEVENLLATEAGTVAETLGHVDYNYYAHRLADAVEDDADKAVLEGLGDTLTTAAKALSARHAKPEVVQRLEERAKQLGKAADTGKAA